MLYLAPRVSFVCLCLLVLSSACASDDPEVPGDPECQESFFADADGDGFGDPDTMELACDAPSGFVTDASDCDDQDAARNPLASEVCDGSDNDCDDLVDTADPDVDAATERAYYRDVDGDGFGDAAVVETSCDKPQGFVVDATDCDDGDGEIHPEAEEVCDFTDNDCDDLFDDDDDSLDVSTAVTYYVDEDNDDFGVGAPQIACQPPFVHALVAGDCDDDDASTNPDASELCDGADNDCDGGIDGTAAAPNQCGTFEGSFSGTYVLSATEQVGNIIVNQMICTGTGTVTVDLDRDPVVQGAMTCTYPGGGGLFDVQQTALLEGDVALDGTITGQLTHEYESFLVRSYSIAGVISGDSLTVDGVSTILPHPMSAVPWNVVYSLDMSR